MLKSSDVEHLGLPVKSFKYSILSSKVYKAAEAANPEKFLGVFNSDGDTFARIPQNDWLKKKMKLLIP